MTNDDPNQGFLANVMGWFAHPFQTNGDALNWILFVGLLLVALWFWHVAFLTLTDAIE